MLPEVMQGNPFRSAGEPAVMTMPHYTETETWEFDLAAAFLCNTLVMDVPYKHEEARP